MQRIILTIVLLFTVSLTFSQSDERGLILGKVIYMNTNVPNEHVINVTSEESTITDENGEFQIEVKEGDVLAFTALNYQLKTVTITAAMIEKNRLLIEVDEKVTELDEVVVTSANPEKFLELKGEEFKQIDYEKDASTRLKNYSLSTSERGMENGLNFVNIFKAIFNSKNKQADTVENQIKVSEVLRQVYDDEFFVVDLKIPQDRINEFLLYVDQHTPPRSLLSKNNEFELIDYLVNQSRDFNKLETSGN
ncbi:carboxypeptidase-like regulatory domain-containing protein [Robertkochia solimangrovi]|uniref:carboxypeptidase-like regulatory domain-containing protein n=1 Tax=Robertkochia solimangrovi TaxID=2213046 RepID=UPI00117F27BE|nr:carboxypeptidase-like regulatory domain-containing protein [Robertkochia solimangrovi]TRZ41412.1 hypothetical protein DMZ48_17150 [Robertkochia solimangrovi]